MSVVVVSNPHMMIERRLFARSSMSRSIPPFAADKEVTTAMSDTKAIRRASRARKRFFILFPHGLAASGGII